MLNGLIVFCAAAALVAFWLLIRQQTAVGDGQFLRSVIPHHAGAILMCEEAPIRDLQVRDLCARIIRSQQAEIDEMKARLRDLAREPARTAAAEPAARAERE